MIWGGISVKGKTALWINENFEKINLMNYCNIISDYAYLLIQEKREGNAKILHDRAPCHTARNTKEVLSNCEFILTLLTHLM